MEKADVVMIKDLPEDERPREKLASKGARSLSDAELLAILLRTGTREDSVMRVAEKLLIYYKSIGLSGILQLSIKELSTIKGIGPVKAVTILAALELGLRLAEEPSRQKFSIRAPQDVADYIMPRLRHEKREHFMIMLLNTKNHVLAVPTISVGSLNASVVHPREVFREAVRHAAAAMILIHNHPSGDPTPSREDIAVTEKLIDSGKIMDISVLDHIIIGDSKFISIKEKGFIH